MKNLFKSKTAYELLEFLADRRGQGFFLSELKAQLKKDAANISRELAKLVREGIVKQELKERKKSFSFNADHQLAPEIAGLLGKENQQAVEARFKREWLLAEEIVNSNPWFFALPFFCFTNHFSSPGGRAYKHLACIHQGYHLWFYFDKQDAAEVGEHLVSRFVEDVSFMEEVNDKIRFFSDRLVDVVTKIPEEGLAALSHEALWRHYRAHEDTHWEYYQWGWIPVAADMFGDNLTERGKAILAGLGVAPDKVEEYLAILTQPDSPSLLKEEQDSLLKIAIKVQADKGQRETCRQLLRKFKEEDVKFFGLYTHSEEYEAKLEAAVHQLKNELAPSVLTELQDHYARYFYTKFIYTEEQGVYSFDHYLKSLVRLVNDDPDLSLTYRRQEQAARRAKAARARLIADLKLSDKNQRFFAAWGDFMITKIYRRYAQLYALYKTTFLLEEIARRVGLSLKELRFMTSQEIRQALFDKKINPGEIRSRVEFSLYYTAQGIEKYYSGLEAKRIAQHYIRKEENHDVKELKGQCGCRGFARGRVCLVNTVADISKMAAGDILVSISTQPDLLPAMKKAAAFVTDQGGVTSHAAIVAREMNTPCVIATKVATKVLRDGDQVEVDADKGTVKIINRAEG